MIEHLRCWNDVINNKTEKISQEKGKCEIHIILFAFISIKIHTIGNRNRNPNNKTDVVQSDEEKKHCNQSYQLR